LGAPRKKEARRRGRASLCRVTALNQRRLVPRSDSSLLDGSLIEDELLDELDEPLWLPELFELEEAPYPLSLELLSPETLLLLPLPPLLDAPIPPWPLRSCELPKPEFVLPDELPLDALSPPFVDELPIPSSF
jgi:hypothetical protein